MSLKHHAAGSEFPALSKGTLRLYGMKYCPYVERSRLVLAAKKIPYETININLMKKPEWFTSRTPTGTVPVLEHDDGRILYESLIICDYLDKIYPEHRLWPADPFEMARHQILIEGFSKVTTAFYKLLRKTTESKDDLNNALDNFEKALNTKFYGGDNAGMTDYMIWPWFERLIGVPKEFIDFEFDSNRFPKLTAWIERMKQEPAVQEVIIKPEEYARFYKSYISGNAEYDFEM